MIEGFTQRELPDRWAWVGSTIAHWAYRSLAAGLYGVVAGSLGRPRVLYGLPIGAVVWTGGYVLLPVAGLYEPIRKYDARTLAWDLGAHLIYGAGHRNCVLGVDQPLWSRTGIPMIASTAASGGTWWRARIRPTVEATRPSSPASCSAIRGAARPGTAGRGPRPAVGCGSGWCAAATTVWVPRTLSRPLTGASTAG